MSKNPQQARQVYSGSAADVSAGASMRDALDISAYLVLGPENTLNRPVANIVAQALDAGFTCIQIRSKECSARELMDCVRQAAEVIAEKGKAESVALLVDDRLDVVLACREQGVKVDGIHVGQTDIPVEVCRAFLGEDAVVGLSARASEMLAYIKTADVSCVDYFGVGPLHETLTKADCGLDDQGNVIVKTLDEIAELHTASPVPIVVGGGVKVNDLPALKCTGVEGFFVVSAVCSAPNPYEAARELVEAWRH